MSYSGGPFFLLPRLANRLVDILRGKTSTALMRASARSIGSGSRFSAGFYITSPGKFSCGRGCVIQNDVSFSSEVPDPDIVLGDRVQINRDVMIDCTGGVSIGDDVLISEGAIVYTHDHGLDPRSHPTAVPKIIGKSAWIGVRAIILPGCREIGEGAIVGAGAIVSKDVAAHTIVAGNPAKVVRVLR